MRNMFSDFPENEQLIRLQQAPQKTKVESQAKPQEIAKLKPVVYEENIRYSIASKWAFDDKCRVVIKEAEGGILFKRELSQPDFMNIKLH